MNAFIPLSSRSVLRLTGEDRAGFLQGLLTGDIMAVTAQTSLYAALLTPQGKILHDLFIATTGDALLLDVEAARLPDLLQRLDRYRLRARVAFEASTGFAVLARPGGEAEPGLPARAGASGRRGGGVAMVDPRHPALGIRLLVPADEAGAAAGRFEDYDRLRLELGVPEGSQDFGDGALLALEANLDLLNGISWTKGCYVGQEVTARTRYRGLIRRRLQPVRIDGPLPPPGTPILCGDRDAGELRSGRDDRALALLRTEIIAGADAPLLAGAAQVTPLTPLQER
ncbi:MAG: folate-binding protein [Rhodospirillaceae bacterium]